MMKKKGLTLQEVLITLLILGLIAAILFPILNKSTPDANKVMLKKAYSVIERAVGELINDDINYPSDVTSMVHGVPVQLGFSYTDPGSTIPADTDKFCYLFTQKIKTVGDVQCPDDSDGSFRTSDGVFWDYKSTQGSEILDDWNAVFYVDVNGDKGPNCRGTLYQTCIDNHTASDTYRIEILYNGKVNLDDAGKAILAEPTNNVK